MVIPSHALALYSLAFVGAGVLIFYDYALYLILSTNINKGRLSLTSFSGQ